MQFWEPLVIVILRATTLKCFFTSVGVAKQTCWSQVPGLNAASLEVQELTETSRSTVLGRPGRIMIKYPLESTNTSSSPSSHKSVQTLEITFQPLLRNGNSKLKISALLTHNSQVLFRKSASYWKLFVLYNIATFKDICNQWKNNHSASTRHAFLKTRVNGPIFKDCFDIYKMETVSLYVCVDLLEWLFQSL